jgi:lipoate---protein ligase
VGAVPDAGTDGVAGDWSVERLVGSAGDLHARPLGSSPGRLVEVLEVTAPSLVLGSTQPERDVDMSALERAGVELTRRRSGGGAVLLVPRESTWIDVTIRGDDPLSDDDVGRAFHWLGAAWARAVARLDVRATVHTGPLVVSPWSRRVCFAGLGAGEVLVDARKLVGISQRRTRDAVRFQSVVLRRWDPAPLLELLALTESERAAGIADLRDVATGLDADAETLVAALLGALPAGADDTDRH